jgi:hypothetical protein
MSYYVWDGKAVTVMEFYSDVERRHNTWVYDPAEAPQERFGLMIRRRWNQMMPEDVPPEFKAYLLLLGVST